MPEMKNEYIEVNTNTVDKLRSKAYDLCIKLQKKENEIIIVDGKKYTLWDVSIDTLLVDMNKFGAKDRNKFVNKYKLNKLLEEITKKNN